MSGKGDDRRPSKVDEQTFSDNWDRVFRRKTRFTEFKVEDYLDSPEAIASYEAELAKDDLLGCSSTVEPESLKFSDVRSNRTTPANDELRLAWLKDNHGCIGSCGYCEFMAMEPVYINADTGEQVTEDWWPEIEQIPR